MEHVSGTTSATSAATKPPNTPPKSLGEKLRYIVDHFDELAPIEDRSFPGMPLFLQKAILLCVMSKKNPGDSSLYEHEIVAVLKDVERKGNAVIQDLVGQYLKEDVASLILGALESYREKIDPSIQPRAIPQKAQSEFVQFVMGKKTPYDQFITQHDIMTAYATLKHQPPSTMSEELRTVVNTYPWQELEQLVTLEVERRNQTRALPILFNTKVFVFDDCPDVHHLMLKLLSKKDGFNWAVTNKACWAINESFYYPMLKAVGVDKSLVQLGLSFMSCARLFHKYPQLVLDHHVSEQHLQQKYKFKSKTIVEIREERLSIKDAQRLSLFIDEFKDQRFPNNDWDTPEMEGCRKWVEGKFNQDACLKTICSSNVQLWPHLSPILCLDVLLRLNTPTIKAYLGQGPALIEAILDFVKRDPPSVLAPSPTKVMIYLLDALHIDLVKHYIETKKFSFKELFALEIWKTHSFPPKPDEYPPHYYVDAWAFMTNLIFPGFKVYVDKGHLAINQFSKISELDKQLLSVPEVLDALDKGNFSEEWFLGVKERIITACKQMSPDFKEPNIITLLIAGKLTLLQMDELKNNGKLAYFDRYNTTLLLNNVLTLDDVVNQTELYQCFNQEFVVYNWAPLYFVVIIVLISM